MRIKTLSATTAVFVLSTAAFAVQANDNNGDHRWMPKPPTNTYWQTPNWSGFSSQQNNTPPPPPVQNYNNRPPAPNYRPPNQANNYPAPNQGQQNMYRGAPPQPPANMYRGNQPPPANMNRGNPYPPQGRPYPGPNPNMYRYGPDNGASAYNIPGYNRYRNNSGWDNNKFWGQSGPSRWMNPSKRNMEQGWDDMINAPSRMGEMPGGWTAPEVTMPNPIDMGDQMQDNVKDLPEQIKNMDVGK